MMNFKGKKSQLIKDLISLSAMPRNQVAVRSGLSNAYIKDLENDHYKNVDRDKLISLAIGMNLSLAGTDRLLSAFDRRTLDIQDIPLFVQLGTRCLVSSAMIPTRGGYQYVMTLLSVEYIGGDLFSLSGAPISSLLHSSVKNYAQGVVSESVHPLYMDLVNAINAERTQRLIENLACHSVTNYLCIECLSAYVECSENIEEKMIRREHIRNLIDFITTYDRFNFRLIDPCAKARFTLKLSDAPLKEPNRVLFYLGSTHNGMDMIEDPLMGEKSVYQSVFNGFTTSNSFVIESFRQELKKIEESVIERLREKKKMVDYLMKLIV